MNCAKIAYSLSTISLRFILVTVWTFSSWCHKHSF